MLDACSPLLRPSAVTGPGRKLRGMPERDVSRCLVNLPSSSVFCLFLFTDFDVLLETTHQAEVNLASWRPKQKKKNQDISPMRRAMQQRGRMCLWREKHLGSGFTRCEPALFAASVRFRVTLVWRTFCLVPIAPERGRGWVEDLSTSTQLDIVSSSMTEFLKLANNESFCRASHASRQYLGIDGSPRNPGNHTRTI